MRSWTAGLLMLVVGAAACGTDAVPRGAGGDDDDDDDDGQPVPAGKPVFVAVGYAGLRVRSLDLGLTWIDEQTAGPSGDNEFLMRGITFGNGTFVTTRGFPNGKVRTSPDGKTWTEHDAPTDQWMGGMIFTGDHFVAAGGSRGWTSPDGKTWTQLGERFGGMGVRTIVEGDGVLIAAGNGAWYRSTDGGSTWALDSQRTRSNEIKVAYCGDEFREIGDGDYAGLAACEGFTRCRGAVHAEGVWLRTQWEGIERSTDGRNWTFVYRSDSGMEDVTVGYVAE